MIGWIVVRAIKCDVREVMASVCGCTGFSSAVGPAHIEGRRAISCNCWWPLLVSIACVRCGRGTNVGRARWGLLYVGAVVGVVRLMGSAGFPTAAGAIAFVLEATNGGAEVSNVGCISKGGGRLLEVR